MKKSKGPQATPSPKVSGANNDFVDIDLKSPTAVFFLAVLDMTWQMALVVLIPIIGGFELDKHFNLTPLLTIIGFVLAMTGTYFVIKRSLAAYNDKTIIKQKGDK